MTLTEEWRDYETRNARTMRVYRLRNCAVCHNLPDHGYPHTVEWVCDSCKRRLRSVP